MDPVAICNMALGMLGRDPIHSLTDISKEAELCSAHYESAVKATLEEGAWTFATGRGTLTNPSASGDLDRPKRFQLPTTVLRVLSVDDGSTPFDWRLEENGGIVCQTATTIYYRAINYVEDPAKWPGQFVRALVYRLASDLAIPLSAKKDVAEGLEAKYLRTVRKAMGIDGMQGSPDKITLRSNIRR